MNEVMAVLLDRATDGASAITVKLSVDRFYERLVIDVPAIGMALAISLDKIDAVVGSDDRR